MRLPASSYAIILFASGIFLTGCIASTSHKTLLGNFLANFKADSKILMAQIPGLTTHESAQLYQVFAKEAQKAKVQPAYAMEQEMEMRLHQVKPTADTASLAALQKLGYAYYVRIEVQAKEASEAYNHSTAQELAEARQRMALGAGRQEADATKAQLTFSLYATDERRLVFTLTTRTEMHSLPIPEQDGDQRSVNLSSVTMAVKKALVKGSRKLFENCQ